MKTGIGLTHFLIGLFLSLSIVGLSSSARAASVSGVAGVIVNDGAQVYDKPNFDAKVIGRLHEGRKVRVSKGETGSYTKFHKIKVGKRFGYISSMDVAVAGGRAPASNRSKGVTGGSVDVSHSKKHHKPKLPVFFSKFFGLSVGIAQYRESISGVDAQTNLLIYGIKFTGPDVLITGPVIDFNFDIHYGAPSYYNSLSTIQPSGFLIMTDALFMLPFLQRQDFSGLFGVGPLITYSSFRVFNGGQSQELSELNIGASFMTGFVYRMGDVAVRAEAKYYVEKRSYPGALLSLQTVF